MHPTLFTLPVPEWMQGFLPAQIGVHAYGTLIAIGAFLAYLWTAHALKKFNVSTDQTQNLFLLIVLGAFVGGRLFFYLEDPAYYFGEPSRMFKNLGSGFVFYGSLIFCLPIGYWFARQYRIPIMQFLDIIAITTCIVHFFGRLGCLGAGCCYGLPHEGVFSIIFTNPACLAKPLHTPLHPTQLYDATLIMSTLAIIWWVKTKKQRFDGQLFLIYILMYATGRSIIENFRGDVQRGFVFDGLLSHSQFISILLIAGVLLLYWQKFRQSERISS